MDDLVGIKEELELDLEYLVKDEPTEASNNLISIFDSQMIDLDPIKLEVPGENVEEGIDDQHNSVEYDGIVYSFMEVKEEVVIEQSKEQSTSLQNVDISEEKEGPPKEQSSETDEKRIVYRCKKCSKIFKYYRNYELHYKHDHKVGRYPCRYCESKSFESKSELTNHLKIHLFTCKTCGKLYKTFGNLEKHLKVHASEAIEKKVYRCSVCNKLFQNMTAVLEHSRVHQLKLYKCTICDKAFFNIQHLQIHYEFHKKNSASNKES